MRASLSRNRDTPLILRGCEEFSGDHSGSESRVFEGTDPSPSSAFTAGKIGSAPLLDISFIVRVCVTIGGVEVELTGGGHGDLIICVYGVIIIDGIAIV